MKYKTVLIEVAAGDAGNLTKTQAKINQWTTNGFLVKFNTYTTGTHYLFQVLLKLEAGE
jgi:hypothetical protein